MVIITKTEAKPNKIILDCFFATKEKLIAKKKKNIHKKIKTEILEKSINIININLLKKQSNKNLPEIRLELILLEYESNELTTYSTLLFF